MTEPARDSDSLGSSENTVEKQELLFEDLEGLKQALATHLPEFTQEGFFWSETKVLDLWGELSSGEKSLFLEESSDGQTRLISEIDLILLEVSRNGKLLQETRQSVTDASARANEGRGEVYSSRNRTEERRQKDPNYVPTLSEKMSREERKSLKGIDRKQALLAAAKRSMKEETGLEPHQYRLSSSIANRVEEESSRGFPGLPSRANIYKFSVEVTDPNAPDSSTEVESVGERLNTASAEILPVKISHREYRPEGNFGLELEGVPDSVVLICRQLQEAGGSGLLVGGAVRDLLLNHYNLEELRPKDWDIEVSGIGYYKLLSVLRAFKGVKFEAAPKTGKSDPNQRTISVVIDDVSMDLNLPRRVQPQNLSDIEDKSLLPYQSSLRRDLSANAIYYDPLSKRVIDPKHGLQKLLAGELEKLNLSFARDPNRFWRALKLIASHDLTPNQDLKETLTRMLESMNLGEDGASHEKVITLLKSINRSNNPMHGWQVLQEVGLLGKIFGQLPEDQAMIAQVLQIVANQAQNSPQLERSNGLVMDQLALMLDSLGLEGEPLEACVANLKKVLAPGCVVKVLSKLNKLRQKDKAA